MHACPVDGCDEAVDDAHLMCRKHWRLVPYDLQLAVWRAYRRRRLDPGALEQIQREATALVNRT